MQAENGFLPDVFHVGFQRTGTTWLQKGFFPLLQSEVYIPETRQWLIYHAKSPSDVKGLYSNLSSQDCAGKLILESEEGFSGGRYRDYYETARKLAWINPKAKILMCIRSQYTSFPSLYYLYVRKGGCMSFDNYVKTLIENKKLDYWEFYQAYNAFFPAKNIKVLVFEELKENPQKYVDEMLRWIGVETTKSVPNERYRNQSAGKGYVSIHRFVNILLSMDKYTHSVGMGASKELRAALKKRKKLMKLIDPLFLIMQKLGVKPGRFRICAKLAKELESLYGPSNRKLFETLNIEPNTTYPFR